jgi:hypothetical protein
VRLSFAKTDHGESGLAGHEVAFEVEVVLETR